MLQRMITLLAIALILVSATAASGKAKEEEKLKIGDPAPKFTLKDPDDKEYSLEKLLGKDEEHGKSVILIMGNRKVRKQANKWARTLYKVYEKREEVVLIMIADLRDLPFFATESMVKWGTKLQSYDRPDQRSQETPLKIPL